MNIFVVDLDPTISAQMLCNRHVLSQSKESAQMLCTAINHLGGETPYKTSHLNHPCNIWCRETKANFNWLKSHGIALCEEYTFRYEKRHKCQSIIESLDDDLVPTGSQTPFALCMPDEYKTEDAVESYRNYYRGGKADIAVWKNRGIPKWF